MAISGTELQFLISMRDQASQIINQVTSAMGGMGSQAGGTQQQMRGLSRSMTELNQSLEAFKKGMAGLRETIGSPLAAFEAYDKGMIVVQRVTNMTGEQMDDFKQKFDDLLARLRAVPQPRLLEIAQQAAQLGITGTSNILEFTEVVAKLETSLKDLGDQAPKLIVRVLNATGEGIPAIEKFGNVLVRMGKDASASEERILSMTAMLAQSTAQFKIGSEALLGLSTAAANLNFQPQLFGTAVQRTLQQLYDASLNDTKGMRALSEMTGITADQFRDLIRSNPADALILFLDALKAVDASGRSTLGFLEMFHLQAAENVRVLGTASQQVNQFREYLATARAEAQKQVALTQEFNTTLQAYFASTTAASNAWQQFKKTLGGALAPVATVALNALTAVLNGLSAALQALPGWLQGVVAWTGTLIASAASLAVAFKAVGAAITALGAASAGASLSSLGGWLLSAAGAALRLVGALFSLARIGSILVVIGEGIAALIAAVGSVPVLIGVAIAAAIAALAVFGVYVYNNWEQVKAFFSQPIGDIVKQAWDGLKDTLAGWFADTKTWVKQKWDDVLGIFSTKPKTQPNRPTVTQGVVPPAAQVNAEVLSKVSSENQKIIEQLDKQSKIIGDITKQEIALDQLRKVGADDRFRRERQIDDAAIARLQGLIDLEKIRADAVKDRLKSLSEETVKAAAFTAAERQIAEMEEIIRQVREKKGALTEKETEELRKQIGLLQQAQVTTAFRGVTVELEKQIEQARAITREQQNQVQITQRILDFEREHGKLTEERKRQLGAQLSILQQTQQFNAVRDRVDAIGTANRQFIDDLQTLNRALKEGTISLEYYNYLVKQLKVQTLDQRDPIGAQVKSMREQIQLLQITGDYMEADRQAQQEINRLRDRGVLITKEHEQAFRQFYRAVQDANKELTSGFQGWAQSVGSMRDNILDLQKSIASSLSSTIVDALTGVENAWQNFFKNMSKQALTVFTNQLLKGVFSSIGNNPGGLFSIFGIGNNPAQQATDAANKLAGLGTQTMNVTAATVNISSGALALAGANQNANPLGGIPANDNTRPEVLPSSRWWGDKEAENAGLYESTQRASQTMQQLKQSIDMTGQSAEQASNQTQSANQRVSSAFDQLNSSTAMTGTAATQASVNVQQLGTASYTAAPGVQQAGVSLVTAGVGAATAAPQVQQTGTATQQTGVAATVAAPQIQKAAEELRKLGQAAGTVSGGGAPGGGTPTPGGLGTFLGINWGQMLGSLAIAGVGFLLSRLFAPKGPTTTTTIVYNTPKVAASKVHGGGLIGPWLPTTEMLPLNVISRAPRLHDGNMKSDEFAAVLQRSERVLTANDNERVMRVLAAVSKADPSDPRGRRRSGDGGTTVNMYVQTPDAQSFQRSQNVVMSKMAAGMQRAARRNG